MATPAAANPAPEELVLEYQPTDGNNVPIGNKTIIKGATWEEIARKQITVNEMAVRAYRRERDAREALSKQIVRDTPAPTMTAEEEIQLTAQLNDPSKARQALRRLSGMDEIEKELKVSREQRAAQQRAQIAYEWMGARPEFYNCDANGAILREYIETNNLDWSFENLDIAYAATQDRLAVRPTSTPPAEANPVPPASRPRATPDIRPGELNGTPAPKSKGLTKADYLKMGVRDPKEYQRHMTNTVLRRALDKALAS